MTGSRGNVGLIVLGTMIAILSLMTVDVWYYSRSRYPERIAYRWPGGGIVAYHKFGPNPDNASYPQVSDDVLRFTCVARQLTCEVSQEIGYWDAFAHNDNTG